MTHWRSHLRPRVQLSRPPKFVERVTFQTEVKRMLKRARDAAKARGLPIPRFPFRAEDVVAIYTRQREAGDGLWFRLADGRVFSAAGEPDSINPAHYQTDGDQL